MMYILVACVILSSSYAAVLPEDAQASTISFKNTNDGTGTYRFSFATSNGIDRKENGYLVNVGEKDEHIVVEGSYSYTDPNGKVVLVRYTADENGYSIINSLEVGVPPSLVASLLG